MQEVKSSAAALKMHVITRDLSYCNHCKTARAGLASITERSMRTRELHVLHRQGECIRESERKMEEGGRSGEGRRRPCGGERCWKGWDEEKERCCRALVSIWYLPDRSNINTITKPNAHTHTIAPAVRMPVFLRHFWHVQCLAAGQSLSLGKNKTRIYTAFQTQPSIGVYDRHQPICRSH